MRILALLFFLISFSAQACELDEEKIRADLFTNARELFGLTETADISIISGLDLKKVDKDAEVAFLEQLSEDRFFDTPKKSKDACPDRIVRVFRVYSQDSTRKCNAVLKSEIMNGIHDVLYMNCGTN